MFDKQSFDRVLFAVKNVLGKKAMSEFTGKSVVSVVAAAPFIANSEDAERYAVMNLIALYVAKHNPEIFNHRPSDDKDIYKRFDGLYYGYKANKAVVKYVKNYLALTMLKNYKNDVDSDNKIGKYNPATDTSYNIDAKIAKLEKLIKKDEKISKMFATAYSIINPIQATAATVTPMGGSWF